MEKVDRITTQQQKHFSDLRSNPVKSGLFKNLDSYIYSYINMCCLKIENNEKDSFLLCF